MMEYQTSDIDPRSYTQILTVAKVAHKIASEEVGTMSGGIELALCRKPRIELVLERMRSFGYSDLYDYRESFERAASAMKREHMKNTRRDPSIVRATEFSSGDAPLSAYAGTFIDVGNEITRVIFKLYEEAELILRGIDPGVVIDNTTFEDVYKNGAVNTEKMMSLRYEMGLNSTALNKTIRSLVGLKEFDKLLDKAATDIERIIVGYHHRLVHRHTKEGIEIHVSPVATDVAMEVYDNIDSNGEIESGSDKKSVTQYTLNTARTIIDATNIPHVAAFISNPSSLVQFSVGFLKAIRQLMRDTMFDFERPIADAYAATHRKRHSNAGMRNFDNIIANIDSIDLGSVNCRMPDVLLTKEERFSLKFRNETIAAVSAYLRSSDVHNADEIVDYIIGRKEELHKFYHDENSFYVCKIGSGNPFSGEAPGALKVIPGERPNANLTHIRGSGFDEVKDFIKSIEDTSKYHPLFLATSPSRTADKANVLLVGPPGCGKSEILRAVGAEKNSVGVFAQGSDFLTCWKGEAEKNPKRLFEEGIRLSKKADKRVHFLIDEIDSVLNNDRDVTGRTNLTLEFQILMDGVVHYPNTSVWGATNFPQRIPHAMLRRFNKVLIVGELTLEDRVALLKHFIGYMPTKISKAEWEEAAEALDGAVGDIIRKVGDVIWRSKMGEFVRMHPEKADELVADLQTGGKFDLSSFDEEARKKLHDKLKHQVLVTGLDLKKTTEKLLANMAIRQEINTAVETYEVAHELVRDMSKSTIG